MRNAFVVLVSLCIGVTSRFIVPSTVSENPISSIPPNDRDEDVILNVNPTTTNLIHASELPNNRTNIDENALYEHAVDKQNNQSERAFIYINQMYKRPHSRQNYFKVPQNILELPVRIQQLKPQALPLQRHNELCKSERAHVNSYFQGYDFPPRTPDILSYFALFNSNNGPLHYSYRSNHRRLDNFSVNDKRDYFELLKSPLLRPRNRGRSKYDGIPKSRYSTASFYDKLKLNRANKQHNPKANILVDERINGPLRSYGFNSAYSPQTVHGKGLMHRIEEPYFEGDFVNDDESSHIASIEKAQDEDKLLDQYLKDTLEDQVTSKEKPVIANDCSYRDSILQPEKTSSSAGHQTPIKNHKCNCGQRNQNNEATIPRKRQERDEIKRNKINICHSSKLSDVSYYEAILYEDSPNKRSGSQLITKLNNSLYH